MMRRPWLVPLALVLVATVVAATTQGLARRRASFDVAGVPLGIGGLTVPTVVPNATSVSWYCGLVSSAHGVAHQAILLVNPSSHARRFLLLRHADGHASRGLLLAHSSLRIPMAGAESRMVISTGGVLALMEASLPSGESLVPCASSPGTSWTVGGLATRTGDASVIGIYNPLAREAVVDVVGHTASGTTTVPSVQGLIVQPGQTLELDAERFAPDAALSAATVVAKAGAVVVTSRVTVAGSPAMVSVAPGVMTPGGRLYFPYVPVAAHHDLTLELINPGSAQVQTRIYLAGFTGASAPATMRRMRLAVRMPVPPGASFNLDLGPEASAIGAAAVAVKVSTVGGLVAGFLVDTATTTLGSILVPYPFHSDLWWLACVGSVPKGGPSVVYTRGSATGVFVDVRGESLTGSPELTRSSANVLDPSVSGVGMSLASPALYEISASAKMTIAPTEVAESCVSLPAT
jgi:hypothetical protein